MGSLRDQTEAAIVRGTRVALANLAKQAMLEGTALEHEAYRCQAEAEQAFRDVKSLKEEGRERAKARGEVMLPAHERAIDHRTGTFKVVQDAKGDHVYYSGQAAMYAGLAAMKFAKAAGLKAMAS